jgi:hypothetical protein
MDTMLHLEDEAAAERARTEGDDATRERARRVIRACEMAGSRDSSFAQAARDVLRLLDERDRARRLAALDRKPLTAAEHLEMRALVGQAKGEGWL